MTKVANELPIYGRVAIKLTEALADYGLDYEGNRVAAIKVGAEAKLTYCVQLARGMPLGLQHLVMNSAAFIWSKAYQDKEPRVPGFLKEGFPGITPVDYLRERHVDQTVVGAVL